MTPTIERRRVPGMLGKAVAAKRPDGRAAAVHSQSDPLAVLLAAVRTPLVLLAGVLVSSLLTGSVIRQTQLLRYFKNRWRLIPCHFASPIWYFRVITRVAEAVTFFAKAGSD